jgi:hypothetical protein
MRCGKWISGILLVITAGCGGGGDGGFSCSVPAPTLTGSPPSVATVGVQYVANFDASYRCLLIFTCDAVDVVVGPAGSQSAHDTVFWIPAPSQVGGHNFRIQTEPDTCGRTVAREWGVTVFAAPVIQSFVSDKQVINPGDTVTLTAVFQGTGQIDGLGPIQSGVPKTTAPIQSDTTFQLRVFNQAGAEVHTSVSVDVLEPPAIHSFTASPNSITTGGQSKLSWSITGTATSMQLDPGAIDVLGTTSRFVSPQATTTYTLTVSGSSTSIMATAQVTVIPPVAPATITKFEATPQSSTPAGTVSLLSEFVGSNGMIEEEQNGSYTLVASVTSGQTVITGPLYHSTRYRLTVQNSVGAFTTQDLLVPLIGPGTFQPTQGEPIVSTRFYHAATRLADGRVFVSGGLTSQGTEIFSPTTETFTAGPNLIEPGRRRHKTALMQDGRVFITGGTCGGPCMTSEIYDPVMGTISSVPINANTLEKGGVAILNDGRVIVAAMFPAPPGSPSPGTPGAILFNPTNGSISPFIPLELPFDLIADVTRLADGRILFLLPNRVEIFTSGADSFSAGAIYDPVTGAISSVPIASTSRLYASAATLDDGRVLITGGATVPGTLAEAYDPSSNTFSLLTTQQIATGFGAYPDQTSTKLLDGTVLVLGGNSKPFAERFDPATSVFTVTGGPRSLTGQTATLLNDGRIFAIGSCIQPCVAAEIYTP